MRNKTTSKILENCLKNFEEGIFWTSDSLEKLTEQQGIKPENDIETIAEYWPSDDNPDALFAFIAIERTERRKKTKIRDV